MAEKREPQKRKRKPKLTAEDLKPQSIKAAIANEKQSQKQMLFAQDCDPTLLTPQQKIAWAMLQADVNIVLFTIQVLVDCRHLDVKFVQRVILEQSTNYSNEECNAMEHIAESLWPIRNDLVNMAKPEDPSVIVPPVNSCVDCGKLLQAYEAKFSRVTLSQSLNKKEVLLARLKCKPCCRSHTPWSINRGKRAKKSQKTEHSADYYERKYYEWEQVKWVEGNERNYFSKSICEQFGTILSHCFASVQGYSEAFTEAMHNLELLTVNSGRKKADIELEWRIWSDAFLEYEIWLDLLSSRKSANESVFRPIGLNNYLSQLSILKTDSFPHIETKSCALNGCKWIRIVDGNWKLRYPLCMFQMVQYIGVTKQPIWSNCREAPKQHKAFCEKHCKHMQNHGWSSDIRTFVSQCRNKSDKEKAFDDMRTDEPREENTDDKDDHFDNESSQRNERSGNESDGPCMNGPVVTTRSMSKKDSECVEKQLSSSAHILKSSDFKNSKHDLLLQTIGTNSVAGEATCFKNIGGKKTLNHWLCGHMVIVAPCGQILEISPLYGSESPSQAFVAMMDHLMKALKDIDPNDWHRFSMVYDNICHVDDMLIARQPLSTHSTDGEPIYPEPFNEAWLRINKAIDGLHIKNHKNPRCKTQYNPEYIQELHPDVKVNTMTAEQTFTWLSRFKKILCAMPRERHHFLLHRLLIRRNNYVIWKLNNFKTPNAPSIDKFSRLK